jgi:hypothetical protein
LFSDDGPVGGFPARSRACATRAAAKGFGGGGCHVIPFARTWRFSAGCYQLLPKTGFARTPDFSGQCYLLPSKAGFARTCAFLGKSYLLPSWSWLVHQLKPQALTKCQLVQIPLYLAGKFKRGAEVVGLGPSIWCTFAQAFFACPIRNGWTGQALTLTICNQLVNSDLSALKVPSEACSLHDAL